jgi:hypothetical protein
MTETSEQRECQYCHNFIQGGKEKHHGRSLAFHTGYFDWRKTKVSQQQSAVISSPEFKHPKIRVSRTDKYGGWIPVIDIPIQFCPQCGRKLGDQNEKSD